MDLQNKTIVIMGLGKSGRALLDFLESKPVTVLAFDIDKNGALREDAPIYPPHIRLHLGQNPTGDEKADILILSPGISKNLKVVQRIVNNGAVLYGEMEFAFAFLKGRVIGITGTNGKTTTTHLVAHMMKKHFSDVRVVGNVGTPIISHVASSNEETRFVAEISSFQLETSHSLHCSIAAIINITPDHLDRHGSMEQYRLEKFKIFQNQTQDDYAIINWEDGALRELQGTLTGREVHFSNRQALPGGVYLEDGALISELTGERQYIIHRDEIFLKGQHNMENVLTAVSIALCEGIPIAMIAQSLREFRGVAHRLQYIGSANGVAYYNDSKGTNPDASIQAVLSFEKNILLIAGGMDKKSDYHDFIRACADRVKKLYLLGETKRKIADCAKELGLTGVELVDTMEEAVEAAVSVAEPGDTVLLSPACASWDMYASYEARGEDFIQAVRKRAELS